MPTNVRYLILGAAIGGVVMLILAGSFLVFAGPVVLSPDTKHLATPGPSQLDLTSTALPTPSGTPTLTPDPTSTTVSLPTATPFPTFTPDPVLAAINAGQVIFTGPLSNDEQVRLYTASLKYVQTTVKDSIRESKAINGVGYGDPTNICGPLAIAIMRDAGLLPTETDPHTFWLLNPIEGTDRQILARVFPPELYEHTRIQTPIDEINWNSDPLEPGDFLFIWHGSGGNFDHMLVVTRVDKKHRAYAVTNFGTPDGYIISETMLYDPNDVTQGIFYTWTRVRDAILGSTGFGGFERWRRRIP